MDDSCKEMVPIFTHNGFFRYNRLPFGFSCGPSKFQRIMETVLKGLLGVACFFDDFLITGKYKQKHLENLERVQKFGLKISLKNALIFKPSVVRLPYF